MRFLIDFPNFKMEKGNPFGLSDDLLRAAKDQYRREIRKENPEISFVQLAIETINFFNSETKKLKKWLIGHKFYKEEVKSVFGLDEETFEKAKSLYKKQILLENRDKPTTERAKIAVKSTDKFFSSESKELKKWLQENSFLEDDKKFQNIVVQLIVQGLSRKEAEKEAKKYLTQRNI